MISNGSVNVKMVDDNVAQLFGRSVRGKKEFPDSEINFKCAISIARHAKDALDPLQQLLPKTLLLREYEQTICRAVAEVGVDINLSYKFDHLHDLLAFVRGPGPIKAASLKDGLDRIGGVVAARRDLLGKRLAGPCVYNNAVAFLRIREIDSLANRISHYVLDER